MRQSEWEEKHRLVPFPGTLHAATSEEYLLAAEQEDQMHQLATLGVDSPPLGLSPTYSRRPSIAASIRRSSAAGSGYQTPLNRRDRFRRRRSISPMDPKDPLFKIVSPSRVYDDDQVSLTGTQLYGWEERIHSPTLFGLDEDILDILPVPYSRRQSLRGQRLSIAPSTRDPSTYYSDTDPTPYLRQLAQQYSQERERRLSQAFTDGQALTLPPEKEQDRGERGDTDSVVSDDVPPDTQF